jgi:hypothetical protein
MDNTVYYPDYYKYPPSEFEDLAEDKEETKSETEETEAEDGK